MARGGTKGTHFDQYHVIRPQTGLGRDHGHIDGRSDGHGAYTGGHIAGRPGDARQAHGRHVEPARRWRRRVPERCGQKKAYPDQVTTAIGKTQGKTVRRVFLVGLSNDQDSIKSGMDAEIHAFGAED